MEFSTEERNSLIKDYFTKGLTQKDIQNILMCRHNHIVSLVHLKRLMKSMNLRKRHFDTPIRDVVDMEQREIESNYGNMGHNSMWKNLQLIRYMV
jgi:hypothetical protein